jgi:hypothetical protein
MTGARARRGKREKGGKEMVHSFINDYEAISAKTSAAQNILITCIIIADNVHILAVCRTVIIYSLE